MIRKISDYSITAYEKVRNLKSRALSILKQEEGQGMVEYALIIGLVSIAAIAALILLGPKITAMFSKVTESLPTTP